MLRSALWDGDAVDEELDRPGGQAAGVDRVPSVERVDLEPVVRNFRNEGLQPSRPARSASQPQRLPTLIASSPSVALTTMVGLAVAVGAAEGGGEVEADVVDVGSG